ncbi:hypothetical protein [Erythrobacter sp. YT30]|uniref:hypothetical protein n=1 Tax=Erythrobacter sp. YT30 TaxID=1735012 RepID=UPI00076D6535|nr:hypothetical protein [Erythrobacter sp. YT30]KWV92620.1 hypothetical protein AUC45_00075 [Erythrobacter sp. YT30]
MDEPPIEIEIAEQTQTGGVAAGAPAETELKMEMRDDGTVVIDLMPLAPPPQDCVEEEPDPFNPEIIVCARTQPSPRFGAQNLPTDEDQFGSAVPRARLKLSDNAEAEANAINQGVGGWNANGGEVRLKIDF